MEIELEMMRGSFYSQLDPRRRPEREAGSMVSKDMNAPANCPQKPVNREFPEGVIKFNNLPKEQYEEE